MMTTTLTLMIIISMTMWMIKTTKNMVILFGSFTILASMAMSSLTKMTIIPFILILTILGGLMILFMYMTTTIPSLPSGKKTSPPLLMVPPLYMLLMDMKTSPPKNKEVIQDSTEQMFNQDNLAILAIIMLTIIITMVFIIKACSKSKGPIRQKSSPK